MSSVVFVVRGALKRFMCLRSHCCSGLFLPVGGILWVSRKGW